MRQSGRDVTGELVSPLAPCAPPARPPLAASRAEAKQMVTSTVAPRPAGIAPFGFPNQWNNGLITLVVGASATAVNATAFAGLYRSETGGAKTRWSLTNTTGTARVARLARCRPGFQYEGLPADLTAWT